MRGSVIKRGNTYMAYYYTGEKINGEYVRKTKSGFKTKIDNYTRFAPYPMIAAMKLAGYEGRSSWTRLGVSALASNAVMAMAGHRVHSAPLPYP